MNESSESRRRFLKAAGLSVGAFFLSSGRVVAESHLSARSGESPPASSESGSTDYTLHIKTSPIEIAPKRIISATTYNGQFPGPLLRFKEGQQVTIDVYNDTDVPEQLHWHGQMVPVDVDGSAEEGTPFIPAHAKRRIVFNPRPAGFRFYHTHNRAGADLYAGQYGGEVGPVYIEPKHEPGNYDREVFLVLKEFEPTFSRGGDMAMDFLSPTTRVKALRRSRRVCHEGFSREGNASRIRSGLWLFTINGRMLRPRGAHPREAGRTSAVPCVEWKRNRDSQSCPAWPFLSSDRLRRQSRPESRKGSRTLAGHGGASFCDRADGPPRRLDHGRHRR